ncbi:MAG: XRE family transcriptional regulator [Defluviitaleaceae bacterium]|nr:XRE family transcriptional regulator [Defluviitaleaceae bacterium]
MASGVNREIGERIKGVRELSEISVSELANRVDSTEGQLSRYESGEDDIPLSVLHKISVEFGMDVTELLVGEAAKLSTYSVIRKGRGIGVDRREAYHYKALAYNFSHRKVDPYLVTIPVKPDDEPLLPNTHGGQEFHYCIKGSFVIKIDRHEITVREGDAIYFNSECPHAMKALGGADAQVLVIVI